MFQETSLFDPDRVKNRRGRMHVISITSVRINDDFVQMTLEKRMHGELLAIHVAQAP
jgi:hypothetical protein